VGPPGREKFPFFFGPPPAPPPDLAFFFSFFFFRGKTFLAGGPKKKAPTGPVWGGREGGLKRFFLGGRKKGAGEIFSGKKRGPGKPPGAPVFFFIGPFFGRPGGFFFPFPATPPPWPKEDFYPNFGSKKAKKKKTPFVAPGAPGGFPAPVRGGARGGRGQIFFFRFPFFLAGGGPKPPGGQKKGGLFF